jgi:murein DD-endopeptidase MepM/ murein hydrolase activator NlpD
MTGGVREMSSRSLPHQHQGSRYVLVPHGKSRKAGAGARAAAYVLSHGGRQFRIGPLAFWLVLVALVIMALWSVSTATYFAFREDVLTRLIARQTEMQFGYEDRIAELRAQVDRLSSRQMLDQEQYEQTLDQISRRQSALESRTNALTGLGDLTSSVRQQPAAGPTRLKPAPMSDISNPVLARQRGASIMPRSDGRARGDVSTIIARLQASLDRVEQRQTAALERIEEKYLAKAERIRGVLADLGIDVNNSASAPRGRGMGGPFVPARMPQQAGSFEQRLFRIDVARVQMFRFARTLHNIPVRKPIDGEMDLMSGFGVRQDPFTGSPAMHTGIDIHGEPGDAVRASADGIVTAAGWSGGYGRSVDIDHGNGLTTRYAHLSSVDVHVGQSVKSGQVLGKVGSSGRSTGPHLHYETRVKGEAVDPQKFLRAGERLDRSI